MSLPYRTVRAIGLMSVLFAAGAPSSAAAQQQNLVADGSTVYGNTCGSCHNARSPLERTDRHWAAIINHMRVRANLTGHQARAVLAFLQATNSNPRERVPLGTQDAEPEAQRLEGISAPVPDDPQLVSRGEGLVSEKACVGCHVVGNVGGQVGPSLNGVIMRRGAEFTRRKLMDPTFNNATSMMPNFGLSREQIEALVAYLATLDGGDQEGGFENIDDAAADTEVGRKRKN